MVLTSLYPEATKEINDQSKCYGTEDSVIFYNENFNEIFKVSQC